jgi:hypothetical protein
LFEESIVCPYIFVCSSFPEKCSRCGRNKIVKKADYFIPPDMRIEIPDDTTDGSWRYGGREDATAKGGKITWS